MCHMKIVAIERIISMIWIYFYFLARNSQMQLYLNYQYPRLGRSKSHKLEKATDRWSCSRWWCRRRRGCGSRGGPGRGPRLSPSPRYTLERTGDQTVSLFISEKRRFRTAVESRVEQVSIYRRRDLGRSGGRRRQRCRRHRR